MAAPLDNPYLVLGNGYVGQRLGQRLVESKIEFSAASRSDKTSQQHAHPLQQTQLIDLDKKIGTVCASHVWYLVPPAPQGEVDLRLQNFLAHLEPVATQTKLVYISTTGVYGNHDGDWVSETTPTNPGTTRAVRRLDAEQQLINWSKRPGNQYVILRVAGIYGPDRLPLQRLRDQQPMVSEAEAPWSNRIHVDDLVEICWQAMTQEKHHTVYNVADSGPSNMAHYFNTLAELSGLPKPPLVTLENHGGQLSDGMLSYLSESRRISNSKVLSELGVELRYPDLSTGLPAALSASAS